MKPRSMNFWLLITHQPLTTVWQKTIYNFRKTIFRKYSSAVRNVRHVRLRDYIHRLNWSLETV